MEIAAGSLWRNRTFIRLFGAYTVSTFGDWIDYIAIVMLFGYVWQANPTLIALIPIASALPGILLAQLAGIWADRFDKLKLMIYSDLVSAVLTLVMALSLNPYFLLILLFFRSAAGAVNYPAQQSLTKIIVPEAQLLKSSALNGMVMQSAKLAGPVLGAAFGVLASPSVCILINSLSFLASALVLLSIGKIKPTKTVSSSQAHTSFLQQWRDGWTILLSRKILLYNITFACIVITTIQLIDSQYVVLLREKAPGTPQLAGWLMSSFGSGALLAILGLNRHKGLDSYYPVLAASVFLLGAGFILMGMMPATFAVYLLPASGFICGTGTGLASVGNNYLMLKETPPEALGRIMGIYSSLTNGIFVIAPLLGSLFVSHFGAAPVFTATGMALIVIGIGSQARGAVGGSRSGSLPL